MNRPIGKVNSVVVIISFHQVNFPLSLSENIVQGEWLVGSASARLLSTLANVAQQKDPKVSIV